MRHKLHFKNWLKFFASLRAAIIVMVTLSVLLAVGTIVESKYDAEAANKLVYSGLWMKLSLLALAAILIAVMIDRWPWKKKHIPFLLAHIGILIMLLGAWITQNFGFDGVMRIEVDKSSRFVTIPITDIAVFQSSNGFQFEETFKKEVDFFLAAPSAEKPLNIPVGGFDIQIIDYKSYVIPRKKIVPSTDPLAGVGIHYQLQSSQINQSDWIIQPNLGDSVSQLVGGAEIIIAPKLIDFKNRNVVLLIPNGNNLDYTIFHKDLPSPFATGRLKEGTAIDLGWMNLKLKILNYYPQAESSWDVDIKETPSPLTKAAIKIKYQGQERWVLLNDAVRMMRPGSLIRFVYSQRKIALNFSLNLKKFEINRYEGSRKVSNYQSLVSVMDGPEAVISMNEPLKVEGLTFYQASFEEDDQGLPKASIFSVNSDPGRWIKYLGALIMSCGIILLFYFRKYYATKSKNTQPMPSSG